MLPGQRKTPPTGSLRPVKGESNDPRCHLASRREPCPLRSTDILPATDVCPHVAEYLTEVFDCALSGPFDNLFLARLSAPRALCRGIIAVISASTVWLIKLWSDYSIALLCCQDFLRLVKNIYYLSVPNRMEIVVPLFSSLFTESLP